VTGASQHRSQSAVEVRLKDDKGLRLISPYNGRARVLLMEALGTSQTKRCSSVDFACRWWRVRYPLP
jgi:hypothetical protein